MGRLERKIDQDLVDRMLAGWKPKPGESRRRGSRKASSGYVPEPIVNDGSFRGPIELNRSKKWKRAKTYAEARAQRLPLAAE